MAPPGNFNNGRRYSLGEEVAFGLSGVTYDVYIFRTLCVMTVYTFISSLCARAHLTICVLYPPCHR